MLARVQRRSGAQVMLSTHSGDLLEDDGIGLGEVLILTPGPEGTKVQAAAEVEDIRGLLEGGANLADAVLPHTRPIGAEQLMFKLD